MIFALITPTPSPETEAVRELVRAADAFNSLGPFLATLLVISFTVLAILMLVRSNQDGSKQFYNMMTKVNTEKDQEIREMRALRLQEHEQHIESLSAIHKQAQRTNDLFEQNIERGKERDAQQASMLANQATITQAFEGWLKTGSEPVQKVAKDIAVIMSTVNSIDARTTDWQEAMATIPKLREDFNQRLDALMAELSKRATKPIPSVPPLGDNG